MFEVKTNRKELPLTPFNEDSPFGVDLSNVRQEFPITAHRAYLNNGSIGPMSRPVLAAVEHFMHDVRDNGGIDILLVRVR